jgi:hypothetical protein
MRKTMKVMYQKTDPIRTPELLLVFYGNNLPAMGIGYG